MPRDISSTRYALLIGINCYAEKPLKGCIRDVEAIKEFVDQTLHPASIRVLAAPSTEDPNSTNNIDASLQWPTHENVMLCFENILTVTEPGDFVYIHFSGHGTRLERETKHGNEATGDLALCLLQKGGQGRTTLLRGRELAEQLNRMVKKGLKATLVLDCCFSGSVSRHGDAATVRYMAYNGKPDESYAPNDEPALGYWSKESERRHGSMLPNWLVDPDGYTILAACGPHETAKELIAQDQSWHGALSFFLLDTLQRLGTAGGRQEDIHRYVRTRFQESWPKQNPMVFGNANLSFFGPAIANSSWSSMSVLRIDDSSFRLQAGQAHGICKGDKFTLLPFIPPKVTSGQDIRETIHGEVIQVSGLTSELKIQDKGLKQDRVQTGWIARRSPQSSACKFAVHVDNALLSLQEQLLALTDTLFCTDTTTADLVFHVRLNSQKEYEIQDRHGNKMLGIPKTEHGDEVILERLKLILNHLIRFEEVRKITNPITSSVFNQSFKIALYNSAGKRFVPEHPVQVTQNEIMKLEVQNRGDKVLYVHVYDLDPEWQVQGLLKSDYMVLPPQDEGNGFPGRMNKQLGMAVPPQLVENGRSDCEDILKIFVTSRPTSFGSFALPRLEEQPSLLASGKENLGFKLRKGIVEQDGSEEWAVTSFNIHTRLKTED